MTTYRVQPTAQAQADVDSIFDWLAERSPDAARRWYEAFWEAAERLKTMPMSCPLAPEADEFASGLRQMVFNTR